MNLTVFVGLTAVFFAVLWFLAKLNHRMADLNSDNIFWTRINPVLSSVVLAFIYYGLVLRPFLATKGM
jgi:hypothetical protein